MGALAAWAGSEPVLPAYIIGMVLAGSVGKDHVLIRRLRTVTFGLLTPFYFIRAGSYVSVPALIGAPVTFLVLLLGKMVAKFAAVTRDAGFSRVRQRRNVHNLADVDRPDLWKYLRAVRLIQQHHRQNPVFPPGCFCNCQRRGPHDHRERLLPAAAPADEGTRREGEPNFEQAWQKLRHADTSWRPAMIKKILVAFDGSQNRQGLQLALASLPKIRTGPFISVARPPDLR